MAPATPCLGTWDGSYKYAVKFRLGAQWSKRARYLLSRARSMSDRGRLEPSTMVELAESDSASCISSARERAYTL